MNDWSKISFDSWFNKFSHPLSIPFVCVGACLQCPDSLKVFINSDIFLEQGLKISQETEALFFAYYRALNVHTAISLSIHMP
jgi:hypothetical protein